MSCENEEMELNNVVVLRGLPGAGKTTLSELIAGSKDNVCEADEFMHNKEGEYVFNPKKLGYCHARCMSKFKKLIDVGTKTVVLSNTSTTAREFKPYKEYAEAQGYRVTIVTVENYHGNVSVHDVPEESMEKMRERFKVSL